MRRVRLESLLASPEEIARLRDLLDRGGVVAIPTDTFYALACDPASEQGVERVFEVKARDDGKPLLVLFSSRDDLERLGVATGQLDRFFGLWPAPLTVILPLSAPLPASRGATTLAVRMPDAPMVRDLLARVGPLTGTSANRSGQPPILDPELLALSLGAEIDLLVDGGRTPGGAPSTIVDATVDPPRVVRPGAFGWLNETDR